MGHNTGAHDTETTVTIVVEAAAVTEAKPGFAAEVGFLLGVIQNK